MHTGTSFLSTTAQVIVNDYRGRNPQHEIDAMIHDPRNLCGSVPPLRSRRAWWTTYATREDAESAIGERAYTCQRCFEGQGRSLLR